MTCGRTPSYALKLTFTFRRQFRRPRPVKYELGTHQTPMSPKKTSFSVTKLSVQACHEQVHQRPKKTHQCWKRERDGSVDWELTSKAGSRSSEAFASGRAMRLRDDMPMTRESNPRASESLASPGIEGRGLAIDHKIPATKLHQRLLACRVDQRSHIFPYSGHP